MGKGCVAKVYGNGRNVHMVGECVCVCGSVAVRVGSQMRAGELERFDVYVHACM